MSNDLMNGEPFRGVEEVQFLFSVPTDVVPGIDFAEVRSQVSIACEEELYLHRG